MQSWIRFMAGLIICKYIFLGYQVFYFLFHGGVKFCRQGVYYLSLAAVGFLVVILGLTVLRLVIFCIVWALTFGRHHLWILPNLTEDVGFFASFWPLYKVSVSLPLLNLLAGW